MSKLICHADDHRAYKARIAAELSNKMLTLDVNGDVSKLDKEKFPFDKLPAYEGGNGVHLQDASLIADHLASDALKGNSEAERLLVQQWIRWADSDLYHAAGSYVYPSIGLLPFNKSTVEQGKKDTKVCLTTLNKYLLTRTFVVGERLTLADVVIACNLLPLYQHVLEPSVRKEFANVNRYFLTIVNQPGVKKVVGDVKLCDGPPKKVEQPKKDQPKKEQPKKEKKADPLDDDLLEEKPKEKDPFLKFNKGNFDLDDFKRFYSNNDEKDSIPYFWSKFDKQNYSIWHCEYKYASELTLTFMSCNLVSGMFQRLEKMRKNAFAAMCILGTDNNTTISGVWVWLGHELAFELAPDWQVDYESYEWKKLDADSEDTKQLVNGYLDAEKCFADKKLVEVKIFK